MLNIARYPVWPDGRRKQQSGFGPLSGTLIEKYDARYVLDPNDLVGGAVWGVPTFLWIDGDGETPTLCPDPATAMVATGVVTPGQPSPHQYPSGIDATVEMYSNGTSYRRDTTRRVDPGDNDDIVVAMKFIAPSVYVAPPGNVAVMFAINNGPFAGGANGWAIYYRNSAVQSWHKTAAGDSTATIVSKRYFESSQNVAMFVMNRDGNVTGWYNGVQGASTATRAGSMLGGGISIGANVSGGYRVTDGFRVEWCAAWYGVGIYETWVAGTNRLIKRLSMESLGLRETVTGTKYWMYSNNGGGSGNHSGASWQDHNWRWWFSDPTAPRAGNPNGCVVSPYQHNGAIGPVNFNPAATAGWTVTGGAIAVANDAAALAAALADAWGPSVYEFTNATGVAQTVYCGANKLVANYGFYLIARYVAGANAQIGWWDTVGLAFTSVGTILDSYALTRILNQAPPNANCRFAIQIPDGCTLRFIAYCLSGYNLNSSWFAYPVPSTGAAPWNIEKQREVLTTEHTPVAGSGSYLVNLAPSSWGGTSVGVDNTVLPCVTTPGDILHAKSAAPGWATGDGTVQIAAGAPVDGVYVDVWSAWKSALQYIQQGLAGLATIGAYDGTKGTAGAMTVAPTIYGGEYIVKYVEIRAV